MNYRGVYQLVEGTGFPSINYRYMSQKGQIVILLVGHQGCHKADDKRTLPALKFHTNLL